MTLATNYFLTAATLKAAFTTSTRDNGDQFYHLIDEAPDDVVDFVRACHDEEFPNDWRYAAIVGILQGVIERGIEDHDVSQLIADIADAETDVCTSDLLNWYSETPSRVSYVDQAIEDGYLYNPSFFDQLQIGQYVALQFMASRIVDALGIK